MLQEFQRLYPTSCLTSELLQIYNGKYVIRASIEIEGKIRATGMAAAESIEVAEDQARQRAILVLPMMVSESREDYLNPQSQQSTPIASPPKSEQSINPKSQTVKSEATVKPDKPQINTSNSNNSSQPQLELTDQVTINTEKLPENKPLEAVQHQQQQISPSESVVQHSHQPTKEALVSESTQPVVAGNFNFSQTSFTPEQREYLTTPLSPESHLPSHHHQGELAPPDLEQQILGFEHPSNIPGGNVTPFTPRNLITDAEAISKDKSETKTTAASKRGRKKNEPVDLSGIIAQTDVEMQRLGWTPEQGRDYLIKTYKKRGRTLLDENELIDFLNYLKSQSTPSDSYAIDPLAGF